MVTALAIARAIGLVRVLVIGAPRLGTWICPLLRGVRFEIKQSPPAAPARPIAMAGAITQKWAVKTRRAAAVQAGKSKQSKDRHVRRLGKALGSALWTKRELVIMKAGGGDIR